MLDVGREASTKYSGTTATAIADGRRRKSPSQLVIAVQGENSASGLLHSGRR